MFSVPAPPRRSAVFASSSTSELVASCANQSAFVVRVTPARSKPKPVFAPPVRPLNDSFEHADLVADHRVGDARRSRSPRRADDVHPDLHGLLGAAARPRSAGDPLLDLQRFLVAGLACAAALLLTLARERCPGAQHEHQTDRCQSQHGPSSHGRRHSYLGGRRLSTLAATAPANRSARCGRLLDSGHPASPSPCDPDG